MMKVMEVRETYLTLTYITYITFSSSPCLARLKHLPHFSVRHGFSELSVRVFGDSGTPEFDGGFVVEEFGDLPSAGEAVENELCSITTDANSTRTRGNEKFSHAKVHVLALIARGATDEGESHRTLLFEDHEGVRAVIGEPAGHQLRFALAIRREHPGVHAQIGQVAEIFRILALDPQAVLRGILGISNTDGHRTTGLT